MSDEVINGRWPQSYYQTDDLDMGDESELGNKEELPPRAITNA